MRKQVVVKVNAILQKHQNILQDHILWKLHAERNIIAKVLGYKFKKQMIFSKLI